MKRFFKVLFLFIVNVELVNAFGSIEIKQHDCSTLDECLALVNELAGPDGALGMSFDGVSLANKIATFGGVAIDPALKLIDSERSGVVKIGESILGKLESLDERYLDTILSLLDQRPELTGLPRALGLIDHPKAAEVSLRRYLESGSSGNQYYVAIKAHKERVMPFLESAIKCEYRCDDKAYALIESVIRGLDRDSRGGVAEMAVKIVSDGRVSDEVVSHVLSLFHSIGKVDVEVESSLEGLFETRANISPLEIEMALVGVYSKRSGEIFSNWLTYSTLNFNVILQIMSQRADVAYDAGPVLETFLKSGDEEVVRDVIGLLGVIGYSKSVPKILPFLTNNTDMFTNISAITALGDLKAKEAKGVLSDVASNYWYPPVRKVALTSLEKIDGTLKVPDEFVWDSAVIPEAGVWGNVQLCEAITKKKVSEPQSIKLYQSYAEKKLSSLAFESEIVGYIAFDEEQQAKESELKGENRFIKADSSNLIEVREPDTRVPHVALKHELGWLAATNKGEWGGELVFIDNNEKVHFILKDNVEDVYNLDGRYFVVAGYSHFGITISGSVYELFFDDGRWSFEKIQSLPHAPYSSWMVESGEVLINTHAGNILLSPKGELSMAECAK